MRTARELMTREILSVSPSMPLDELARRFTETRVSGFPVVDEVGALAGVVTESDLIHRDQHLHIPTAVAIFDAVIYLGSSKRLEKEVRRMVATTVGEIMTVDPVTLREDTPIDAIATAMAERNAHTLPVLDSEGRLVGVIGKLDLIRAAAGPCSNGS